MSKFRKEGVNLGNKKYELILELCSYGYVKRKSTYTVVTDSDPCYPTFPNTDYDYRVDFRQVFCAY